MTPLSKRRESSLKNCPTMLKKCILACFIACSAICLTVSGASMAQAERGAAAEIAMELTSGYILEEKNADLRLPMASTTKIMTAIIIIEDCDLDEVITVPDAAVGADGSSIYLKEDEEIDVRDLLYGLMLRSGNDSAAALAIHHSGSIEKFAEKMNEKAAEIGAEDTNFKNPSGLPDDEHYTTARDLCRIAAYAMRNKTFKEVVSTSKYVGKFRSFQNKNKLLASYEGATGVKTGYTVKAGRCLVASAERNGMEAVCVVLDCPDMYGRCMELLDYCLKSHKLIKIDENKVFMSGIVPCKVSENVIIPVKIDEKIDFKVVPLNGGDAKDNDGAVAKLEIYGQKGLILSQNLYSIDCR